DSALVKELQAQIREQQELPETEASRFMTLDERFHRTLAEAAGKAYAWKVIEQVKGQMDRVRYLSALQFPKRDLVAQHTEIVKAIARGDPGAASAAMRVHLQKILTDLPAVAAARPDFFDTGT